MREIDWLPPSCAYRRLAGGQDLLWWHPLVSGDPATVHGAGVCVRGRAVDERRAGMLEHYIVDWPGQMPRTRRPRRKREMMQDALYGGVNVAVLTAMRPDLSVDLDLMAAHCTLAARAGRERARRARAPPARPTRSASPSGST